MYVSDPVLFHPIGGFHSMRKYELSIYLFRFLILTIVCMSPKNALEPHRVVICHVTQLMVMWASWGLLTTPSTVAN